MKENTQIFAWISEILADHVRRIESPDPEKRLATVEALGRMNASDVTPLAEEALIRRLADDDAIVRCAAAESLGALQSVLAIPALLEVLKRGVPPQVRQAAACALGEIASTDAVPALIGALSSESFGQVRAAIAEAIGQIGDARGADALLERLEAERETEVRESIVLALGGMACEKAVPYLKRIRAQSDPEMRTIIHFALGQIRSKMLQSIRDASNETSHPELFADIAAIERHNLVDACERVSCRLIAEFRTKNWLQELMEQAVRPWGTAYASDDSAAPLPVLAVARSVLLLRDGEHELLDVRITLRPRINDEDMLLLGIRIDDNRLRLGSCGVVLLAEPDIAVQSADTVRAGEEKVVSFQLPSSTANAWRGIETRDLSALPFRFVLRPLTDPSNGYELESASNWIRT